MSAFSVFQASFDGGLRPQHRRRGRLAAIMLTSAAVVVIGGSFLTILHLSANQLSDMANAGSPDVRPPAIVMSQDKSCAGQSWPFIEGRCLIDTQSLKQSERAQPGRALAAREKSGSHVLASRKKRARAKYPESTTALATGSRSTQTAASTTGASPRNEANSAPVKATNAANAAPPETPLVTTPPAATPAASPTPPKPDNAIAQRRAQDQQRREAQRKQRLTREQREARAEMRARRDEQSSANRWNNNPYSSSYSAGWQRGPFDGGFFSTIR